MSTKIWRSNCTGGIGGRGKVGRVHTDDARDPLRVLARHDPHEDAAPVVSGDHRAFVPARVDHADQARVDPLAVVRDVGLVGAAVAGKIGRDDVEARGAERGDLVAPRVRELGKAVQQQHQRPVGGPASRQNSRIPLVVTYRLRTGADPSWGTRHRPRSSDDGLPKSERASMNVITKTAAAVAAGLAVVGLSACGGGSSNKTEARTLAQTSTGDTTGRRSQSRGTARSRARPTPRP